jgi:hypothetical protein
MKPCNHVQFLTKPDNFVACRLCDQIWWDSLAYERSQQPTAATKPPTANSLAKAASEGGARQINLKLPLPQSATSKVSYYET